MCEVKLSVMEIYQVSLSLSLSLRLMFKGIFLYTVGILFHVEWCIRQLALVFFNHNL